MTNKKRKSLNWNRICTFPCVSVSCILSMHWHKYVHSVIMKGKLHLFLLPLNVYYQVFASDDLNITQTPEQLQLEEGQTGVITCSWDISNPVEKIRVEWKRRNSTSPTENEHKNILASILWSTKNKSELTYNNCNNCSYNLTRDEAVLQIHSVNPSDVGIYICEVNFEIPTLQKGHGNGTQLHVGKYEPNKHPNQTKLFAAIAVVGLLAVVILLGYFLCKRSKKAEKDLLEERIQEGVELNRVNSNMNHADEDNSSSSNSERWAVSTMYESYPFDYFAMKTSEHQDNTEACSAPNLPES